MTEAHEIFRAVADPTRLRILALLRAMELSIGELAQVLGQSQPRVSWHVKILADAGIVERCKEGSWVFLRLGDKDRVAPVLAAIDAWSSLDQVDHWAVADIARLAAVRADRARVAEAYFDAHAAEWDAMRSLHVAESQVEAAILSALAGEAIGRLVDVGTGTGRMIELFAGQVAAAIGVDRSSEMLRMARVKLAKPELQHAELRQGDMFALPLASGTADVVIIHQVLHYAQSPDAAITEAARLLALRGRLLVVDFGPHDNEELRSKNAHARLGFSDEQIGGWFAAAGLEMTTIRSLEGGALTVKLWLGRRPAAAELRVVAA
jgi:ubiquinone/menaquinone biosynthesis C-methylase UbiE